MGTQVLASTVTFPGEDLGMKIKLEGIHYLVPKLEHYFLLTKSRPFRAFDAVSEGVGLG